MKITLVDNTSAQYAFLQQFAEKNGLLFNSAKWLGNYSSQHIRQCTVRNKNDEIIGCFVYYTFRKAFFNFVICAPFTPHIDLFYINPSQSEVGRNTFDKEVAEAVAEYFNSLKAAYISFSLPVTITDTQPFIWKGYNSSNRYTYHINLSKSKEELYKNLSSEKRKSINKAQKDNLVVQETRDFALVYELVSKSLSRNGVLKNTDVIRNILFSFSTPQNAYAFVAINKGVAIGATFCVVTKNAAIYLFGGFDAENKHHGAGVSCMWSSILKAKELGLDYFDFEGSMNKTIERYFREFGGKLVKYAGIEKIHPTLNALMNIKRKQPL